MLNIKHTEEFDLAYRFVTETNLNIFLTGKAGTGKTTFLKYLRENCFKRIVVAAPTGVAAINAGGVTLHSLFQLPFAPFIPSGEGNVAAINNHSLLSTIRFNKEKLYLLRNLELLVIDEASMVASHTVDAIDTILKSIRRRHREPFGGTQVLFIGDLHQLQPVVKNQEWQFLKEYYSSVFFFDSIALKENVPVMIELKEIFRQKDQKFVDVLNEIRHNNLTPENLDLLNSRLKKHFIPEEQERYVTLTTHNYQSDTINKENLQKLSTRSQVYNAEVRGDFPENLYPAEPKLELKEGAQVMFLKNDLEEKKYFNGKLGVITRLSADVIKVKCKGESEEISVKKHEWGNVNYKLNADTREITEEVLGSFTQYPLRLAWAITIHKSQGLTFDKLIIDAENAFANGQVYVALSRCTSLEGLILTSPVNHEFLGAHKNLVEWQQKNNDEKNLPQKFINSRQNYALQELQNIFTWTNWYFALRELQELIQEHKDNLLPECIAWISELIEKQKAFYEVSIKFKERVIQLWNQNPAVEENQLLQQRLKDAANYFSGEIMKWKEKFNNHSLSTDTKKIARKIDASLNEIHSALHEILHKINHCKNGFRLDEYLKKGKKAIELNENIQSSYAQNQAGIVDAKESVHEELYERIAGMRKRIGREINVPLFLVFSNNAIKNVCACLPGDKNALLKVKGFGKAKVKQYGDEVTELVREYCQENNLEPQEFFEDNAAKENKSATVETTVLLFKKGNSFEEIAKQRQFAVSTIEGHMAQAVRKRLIPIEDLMPFEEVKTIAQYFPSNLDFVPMNSIIQKAPGNVTFGKLKMVLAWLQLQKEQ